MEFTITLTTVIGLINLGFILKRIIDKHNNNKINK